MEGDNNTPVFFSDSNSKCMYKVIITSKNQIPSEYTARGMHKKAAYITEYRPRLRCLRMWTNDTKHLNISIVCPHATRRECGQTIMKPKHYYRLSTRVMQGMWTNDNNEQTLLLFVHARHARNMDK
jgi:hypothetical protein